MKLHLLTLFLALAASVAPLFAQSGTCGTNLTWILNKGTLTISGTGAMTNYTFGSSPNTPWYSYRSSITTVIIEDGVTSIGEHAFEDCYSLTSITIPNSVTSIGCWAFHDCWSLTSITIPNSVTSIGDGAFWGCSSLTSITIPNSVTSIGDNAFGGCSGLTSITIPNSVTSIGNSAFYQCTSLTSINVDAANSAYCDIDGVLFSKDKTVLVQYPAGKTATSYTIPNSVTSIGNGAFGGCSSLTAVTIPESVTSNGQGATFQGCTSLVSVQWNAKSCTIEKNEDNSYYPPFHSLSSINDFTFGDKVETIPACLCFGLSSLTSITIPNSVTSIGDNAFDWCTSLTSITIPNSVTSMGKYAFWGCSSLTSITCEAVAPPTLENNVFGGVNKSIPLYVPAQSIDLYKAADQWKDFTNILPIGCNECVRIIDKVDTCSAALPFTWRPWHNGGIEITDISQNGIKDIVYMEGSTTVIESIVTLNLTLHEPQKVPVEVKDTFWQCDYDLGEDNWISADVYDYELGVIHLDIPNAIGTTYKTLDTDIYGCDSITIHEVIIIPEKVQRLFEFCQSDLSLGDNIEIEPRLILEGSFWGNFSGDSIIRDTTQSVYCFGFDSITIDTIRIYPAYRETWNPGLCADEMEDALADGIPFYDLGPVTDWSQNGLEYYTEGSIHGCDSIIVLDLTPIPNDTIDEQHVQISAFPYTVKGVTFNSINDTLYIKTPGNPCAEYTKLIPTLIQYTVTFKNEDGTILDSRLWNYGTTPTCTEPTKPADAQYTYTFAGWDKEIAAVTADATYTATYSHTVNQYTVTFMDGNTVLGEPQTVEYGQAATAPEVEIPQCRTLTWDKNFSKVTGNLTVKAVWMTIPLASGTCGAESDGSNLQWNLSCEGVLTIKGSGNMADYISNEDVPWYAYRDIIISVNTSLSNVTSFGENAFSQCVGLTSISIPYDVESIGNNTFAGCSNLSSVTFESPNPPSIGTDCFAGCSCTFYVPCGAKEAYAAALNVEESRVKTYKPEPFTGGKKSSFSFYNNDDIRMGKSAFSDPEDWYYRNGNKFWCIIAQTSSNSAQYNYIQLYFWVDTDTELYTYGDGNQGVKPGTYSFQAPKVVQIGQSYYGNTYAWYVDGQYYNNCAIGLTRDSYYGVCPASSWAAENYYNGFNTDYNPVVNMNNATIVVKEGRDGHIYIEIWVTPEGKTYPELYITINEPKREGVETYKLNINHMGEGSITVTTSECDYAEGEEIILTPIPDYGWIFVDWSGECANQIVDNGDGTYTFTIPEHDCTLTARFIKFSDNITLQENEDADYYTLFAEDYNGLTVNTATLNRQFTQGKWATLCLPFDVNKALMMSLGLYNRVFELRYAEQLDDETIQMYFAPAQSIEAGKGYVVNANTKLAQKTSFVFPNVTINTDSDNGDITALTGYNDGTNRGNLFLVGTLRTGILQGSTTGNTYLGLKDNQLYYPNTTTGTSIRAYRGFFRTDSPVNASYVRIIAEGETVSELQVVGTAPSDWSDKSDPSYPSARKYIDNGILYIRRNGTTYNAQGQVIIVN